MALFYISEYSWETLDTGGYSVPAPLEPATLDQAPVVVGATSLQSAVFQPTTRIVMISTDAVCSYVVGANPTATTSHKRMAANETRFFGVLQPNMRIAVIANT